MFNNDGSESIPYISSDDVVECPECGHSLTICKCNEGPETRVHFVPDSEVSLSPMLQEIVDAGPFLDDNLDIPEFVQRDQAMHRHPSDPEFRA